MSEVLSVTSKSDIDAPIAVLLPGMRGKLRGFSESLNGKEVFLVHSVKCDGGTDERWTVRPTDGDPLTFEVHAEHLEVQPDDLSSVDGNVDTTPRSGLSGTVTPSQADRKKSRGESTFFTGEVAEGDPSNKGLRGLLKHFLKDARTEMLVGAVILVNFFLICLETDYEAEINAQGDRGTSPPWISHVTLGCFLFFCMELGARIFVERWEIFRNNWNNMDMGIVGLGFFEYFMTIVESGLTGFSIIRVARLVRLVRLVRVMRLFSVLKELRRLIQMMGSCFKTLFWSFLLLMLVMTIFSIVAVELVNPIVQRLSEEGKWDDCDRCKRSFMSTFHANLTFFQTVVAGDSWGFIAVPVIEAEPWSAVVFVGALLTLVFGVLNLIVAVIVDTFAESRENDVGAKALELEAAEQAEKMQLYKMFQRIDADSSGSVTFEELQDGARKVAEFRHLLRVMDIDRNDLRDLFQIVDEDRSGEIDPSEFIEAMWRMKNGDSRTATHFVKHFVRKMDQEFRDGVSADLAKSVHSLSCSLSEVVRQSRGIEHGSSSPKIGRRRSNTPQTPWVKHRSEESMGSLQESMLESEPAAAGPELVRLASFGLPKDGEDHQFPDPGPLQLKAGVPNEKLMLPELQAIAEETVEQKLQDHESTLEKTIKHVISQLTQDALEAAMLAATHAAKEVMSQMSSQSKSLASQLILNQHSRSPLVPESKAPSFLKPSSLGSQGHGKVPSQQKPPAPSPEPWLPPAAAGTSPRAIVHPSLPVPSSRAAADSGASESRSSRSPPQGPAMLEASSAPSSPRVL